MVRDIYEKSHLRGKIKSERGMMTVEATLSLTLFVSVIMWIINLTNVFVLHNAIQNAMNSAAKEVASVSYLLQASKIRAAEQQVSGDGSPYTGDIYTTANQVIDTYGKATTAASDIASLYDNFSGGSYSSNISGTFTQIQQTGNDINSAYQSGKQSAQYVKGLLEDPHSTMVGLIYCVINFGIDKANDAMAEAAASALTPRFLTADGSKSAADTFLKKYGVEDGCNGLSFEGSSMLGNEGNDTSILFTCSYEISMDTFMPLVPKGVKLKVVQQAVVSGWMDGDSKYLDQYR